MFKPHGSSKLTPMLLSTSTRKKINPCSIHVVTTFLFLPQEGNNFDDSVTSSLSTSTGLSSSHSTVGSIKCNANEEKPRDLQSTSMSSTFLDKESMIANFGDSKIENSLSEPSFSSLGSGSFTSVVNAEDSGIDDSGGSAEKVRLELGEDRYAVQGEPVAVSSPADSSTPLVECNKEENKLSWTGSFSNDQNQNEIFDKENVADGELQEESLESSGEGINSIAPCCLNNARFLTTGISFTEGSQYI